jgi:hypothetical protein
MECDGKSAVRAAGVPPPLAPWLDVFAAEKYADAVGAASSLLAFEAMAQRDFYWLAVAGHAELPAGAGCKSRHG